MDILTILATLVSVGAFVGLAWLSGYELGSANGRDKERSLANLRVNALLERENRRAPRTRRARK